MISDLAREVNFSTVTIRPTLVALLRNFLVMQNVRAGEMVPQLKHLQLEEEDQS